MPLTATFLEVGILSDQIYTGLAQNGVGGMTDCTEGMGKDKMKTKPH